MASIFFKGAHSQQSEADIRADEAVEADYYQRQGDADKQIIVVLAGENICLADLGEDYWGHRQTVALCQFDDLYQVDDRHAVFA